MTHTRMLIGDVRDRLAELPDRSVDLILTSPPYLALRSYLPADHPDKYREIGSEPTPAAFIDTMLALTAEFRRVLHPLGSICIELGDTYSGSGGAGGDYGTGGLRDGQAKFAGSALKDRKNKVLREDGNRLQQGPGWPLAKSLTLIPELYRVGLAYGINPLTGQPSPAGRWRVRQVHRHCRPNPPVGALGDKFRPSVSEWAIACTSGKRWFDLDAVRTEFQGPTRFIENEYPDRNAKEVDGKESARGNMATRVNTHAGAPPLDHTWNDEFPAAQRTPTHPYPGQHYATFSPTVIAPFIEAMCPREVCVVCGEPRRRIVETTNAVGRGVFQSPGRDRDAYDATRDINKIAPDRTITNTLGWSDCGHGTWRRGVVLDPFGGTGTTAQVANGHGRDAILIDLDPRNIHLAAERVGMFLEVTE